MKKLIGIALAVVMLLTLGVAPVVYANNSIDTSGTPTHWAIITLADGEYVLNLQGWYTAEPSEPGPDGTINHVTWEVMEGSYLPRMNVGDSVFSIYGWYEDGSRKWLHNAKDFNLHLETDVATRFTGPHDGLCSPVSGKTYGTGVSGTIEWHWWTDASNPFVP